MLLFYCRLVPSSQTILSRNYVSEHTTQASTSLSAMTSESQLGDGFFDSFIAQQQSDGTFFLPPASTSEAFNNNQHPLLQQQNTHNNLLMSSEDESTFQTNPYFTQPPPPHFEQLSENANHLQQNDVSFLMLKIIINVEICV